MTVWSALVVGEVSFGQAATGIFVSIGSIAAIVSMYIWRHNQTTDVAIDVETIVDTRVIELVREMDLATGGSGAISDGLAPSDVPRTRELVAEQQRERQTAIERDFSHARRQFAWVSLGSFTVALTFAVYNARDPALQPWPPDVYHLPLVVILVLILWALYTGIKTFNRASREELELETEAKQCEREFRISDN